METWAWLVAALVAVAAAVIAAHLLWFRPAPPEPFEAEGTPGGAEGAPGLPEDAESPSVSLGDAQWAEGSLGLGTVSVPFSLDFPDGEGAMTVSVRAQEGSTFVSSVEADGAPAAKKTTGEGEYEFAVGGTATGVVNLGQTSEAGAFSLSVAYGGEATTRTYEPPSPSFPPDGATSPNVRLGPPSRSGASVTVPFEIVERRPGASALTLMWRAPARSTFVAKVLQEGSEDGVPGHKGGSASASHAVTLRDGVRTGSVEMQQAPGSAPEFRLWARYDGESTAILVPGGEGTDDPPPTPPGTVTPVEEVVDMVDVSAFPQAQRQPADSRVSVASPRIRFEIPTAERVKPGDPGHVLRVPFVLDFAEEDAPKDARLVVTWQLDPATTQLRALHHAGREITPVRPMAKLDSFEASVGVPAAEPSVLVFDQPYGRRAVSVTLAFAGETSTVDVAGEASEERSAGFVGAVRPPEDTREPPVRFTDVHQTAEERIKVMYEAESGSPPDEQTTEFLMTKYFEWDGDVARVGNLISTIGTVASSDPADEQSAAVQRAIASLEAGATPQQAKDAVQSWREYETHRAMWRPDQSRVGYPGATALKRPWGEVAVKMAEGHSSEIEAVPANSTTHEVAPGDSEGIIGQGHWLFV